MSCCIQYIPQTLHCRSHARCPAWLAPDPGYRFYSWHWKDPNNREYHLSHQSVWHEEEGPQAGLKHRSIKSLHLAGIRIWYCCIRYCLPLQTRYDCRWLHGLSPQGVHKCYGIITWVDYRHADSFYGHQHTPKSGSTRQTRFPRSRFGRPYHSPKQQYIPDTHHRQVQGPRCTPTTLLSTSTTLLDVPRYKWELKLASSTESGCSRQDLSVRHLVLPVSPSLAVLFSWVFSVFAILVSV